MIEGETRKQGGRRRDLRMSSSWSVGASRLRGGAQTLAISIGRASRRRATRARRARRRATSWAASSWRRMRVVDSPLSGSGVSNVVTAAVRSRCACKTLFRSLGTCFLVMSGGETLATTSFSALQMVSSSVPSSEFCPEWPRRYTARMSATDAPCDDNRCKRPGEPWSAALMWFKSVSTTGSVSSGSMRITPVLRVPDFGSGAPT